MTEQYTKTLGVFKYLPIGTKFKWSSNHLHECIKVGPRSASCTIDGKTYKNVVRKTEILVAVGAQ